VNEIIDAGDKVLQLVTVHARTSRDGVEIVHHPAAVWTIRDGAPVPVHFFLEQDLAREFAEVD
jgi:ketosteroid isomerase-like protein